ncbi:hypothetical protein MPTK1_5g19940 [Marchantia polymorpha subsp. ruderalis]|uniref:Uncharacterized protein n=2 Tax=Marchantia polymorpha TaxID=3197 RepID=A0AAF6BK85_MARPO|nr:hypothetical protein MARPO_0206s0005 [Marchantia polymorpha]BBN12419.1 hypothetical protein Mp_5g19940 [Marchantia polymorpha subsp. ruderalis]|eukprot:PTQ27320.1 hypothetical protein MARPO_0206s0005 [Marchantia polymorpha]
MPNAGRPLGQGSSSQAADFLKCLRPLSRELSTEPPLRGNCRDREALERRDPNWCRGPPSALSPSARDGHGV